MSFHETQCICCCFEAWRKWSTFCPKNIRMIENFVFCLKCAWSLFSDVKLKMPISNKVVCKFYRMEICFYASAFRHRRHYVFGSSVCTSVRPKPEIPSFHLSMGPLVHPTNRDRFAACPSVRSSVRPSIRRGFRAFAGECIENGLKFCMLRYLDDLQKIRLWLRSVEFSNFCTIFT